MENLQSQNPISEAKEQPKGLVHKALQPEKRETIFEEPITRRIKFLHPPHLFCREIVTSSFSSGV
jgi:hypothetical protein